MRHICAQFQNETPLASQFWLTSTHLGIKSRNNVLLQNASPCRVTAKMRLNQALCVTIEHIFKMRQLSRSDEVIA